MAKSTIGRGQFSGKLGGDVFVVRNGQQVVRAYQPVVSNPKSEGQNMQRAKVNLVGRFSQITPKGCLLGLGANAISRRARFLQLQLRNTTAGYAAGSTNVIAKLLPEDIVFSEGAVIPSSVVSQVIASDHAVSVTISKNAGVTDPVAAASGLMVIAVIMTTDGIYESVLFSAISTPATTANVVLTHQREGAYIANVYAVPFESIDGSELRTVTGELISDGADLTAMLSVGTGASAVSWGRSTFVSTSNYSPQSKEEENVKSKRLTK